MYSLKMLHSHQYIRQLPTVFSLSSCLDHLTLLRPTAGSPTNPNRQVLGDTIMFHSVQIGSSAVYQCNASNEHGYLLANAFVNVLGETQWELDFNMETEQ